MCTEAHTNTFTNSIALTISRLLLCVTMGSNQKEHLGDLDQPIEGGLDIGHTPIYYQNLEEHE